jgi:hypothetical protein
MFIVVHDQNMDRLGVQSNNRIRIGGYQRGIFLKGCANCSTTINVFHDFRSLLLGGFGPTTDDSPEWEYECAGVISAMIFKLFI